MAVKRADDVLRKLISRVVYEEVSHRRAEARAA